jgi:hypothetical protein
MVFLHILVAGSLISSTSAASTEITINGAGYAVPLITNPTTVVEVYDKVSMILLGTTATNTLGYYTITLSFVGTEEIPNQVEEGARLIQNPSVDDVNVELSSNISQDWQVSVYDVSGKLKYRENLSLDKGIHNIKINGLGNAGMNTIVLKGISSQYALKAILTESVSLSPHFEVSGIARTLKSTMVGDSLLVVFTPPSQYIGMDTTVVMQSQQVNYILEQIPYVHNFWMKPYTVNADTVPELTLTFDWVDGSTDYYSVGSDGYINVYKEIYYLSDTTILTLNTSNTFPANEKYLEWTIGRKFKQRTNVKNLFQNPKEQSPPPPNGTYIPPEPTPITLSILPDTFALYLVPAKVPNTATSDPADSIRMDDAIIRGIMAGWDCLYLTKFIEVPEVTDSVDIIQMSWHLSTGNQMPEADLDTAMHILISLMSCFNLSNGDSLFPPARIYRIYSDTDPRFLNCAARDWDNFSYTAFDYTGGGTGGAGNEFIDTYTYDGLSRIKNGNAFYYGALPAVILAELCHQIIHITDPGSGNLSPYVNDPNNVGHLSEMGRTMIQTKALFDIGTISY